MSTLAILGVGNWGRNYIKAIEAIPDANLKYLCLKKKKALDGFANKFIKVYDYKDLLKFKDIDGIIIATPSITHYELARFFLSRSYNLLIEKPFTTSYKDAEDLKKIYQRTKAVVMVGHIYLYNAAYLKFKEFIKKVGEIRYLDFEGCDFGPFPKDSSALWEWAPHDVSMCLDILSELPLSVSAWAVGKDMVYARLKFKNTQAFMKFGWLSPVKKRKVIIVGSKNSIIFDDILEKKVCLYGHGGTDVSEAFYPKYSKEEPLISELKEFVNCLKSKKKPKTDLEDAVDVIKVIQRLQESIIEDGKLTHV